jgi:hypothetical protein
MIDEIETILDVDLSLAEDCTVGGPTPDCQRREVMKLIKAARGIRSSLPDDLEARREAAVKHLRHRHMEISHSSVPPFERFVELHCRSLFDKPEDICAWKRCLGIHTGDFSAESEYYPPEPAYPEQWLEHMSEESAEWLVGALEIGSATWFKSGGPENAPDELLSRNKGLVSYTKGACPGLRIAKWPFVTGGLELPDFIDEEEL